MDEPLNHDQQVCRRTERDASELAGESRCQSDNCTSESSAEKDGALPRFPSLSPTAFGVAADSGPDVAVHPRRIGRYEIRSVLGQGGMGVVYEAEQLAPVKRRVALKLIRWGLDSRNVLARFQAEQQALALMDHPNIARVLDAGATEWGRPYVVMELVRGVPITRYCDEHRLSIGRRLELFAGVCDAVHHAHTKGVIHRDLKPPNILVSDGDGTPAPKVIDFGVAKAIAGLSLADVTFGTGAGQPVGTPGYMSPEQVAGDLHQVDTRTDVYSLGVLLYELLCGRLPLEPATLHTGSMAEMRRLVCETPTPRPSTLFRSAGAEQVGAVATARATTPRELVSTLRSELEWIALRALRKQAGDRYGSVAQMAEDVRNYLAGRPLIAGPDSWPYRARKFVQRHKAIVGGAAVVAVVLLLGVVGTSVGLALALRAGAQAQRAQRLAELHSVHSQIAEADALAATDHWGRAEALYETSRDQLARLGEDTGEADLGLRHLDRLVPGPIATWTGHVGRVDEVAFSPDGRQAASGGRDGTVRLWDVHTGKPLAVLPGHEGWVGGLAYDGDGRWLYSVDLAGVLRRWNLTDGLPQGSPEQLGHAQNEVAMLAVSSAGDGEIAAPGGDGSVRLFARRPTGQAPRTLKAHTRAATSVAWFPDGRQFASAAHQGNVSVWDSQTLELLRRFDLSEQQNCVAVSPDGRVLASAGWDRLIHIWDLATGKELSAGQGHTNAVTALAFTPDGRRLVSCAYDGSVRLWDVATGSLLRTFRGHGRPAVSLAVSSDGRRVLTGGWDGSVKLWDLHAWRQTTLAESESLTTLSFSPDGRQILTAGAGKLKSWDLATGQQLVDFAESGPTAASASFSPDGRRVYAGTFEGAMQEFDAATGKLRRTLGSHFDDHELTEGDRQAGRSPYRLTHALMTPDGKWLISAAQDGTIKRWNTKPHERSSTQPNESAAALAASSSTSPATSPGHGQGRSPSQLLARYKGGWVAVAISPDARWLAVGTPDLRVVLHDLWSSPPGDVSQVIATPQPSPDWVVPHFTADGRYLVITGGRASDIRLWDMSGRQPERRVEPDERFIEGLTSTPDGRRLLYATGSDSIIVLDIASGQVVRELSGFSMHMERPRLSPDGRWLAYTKIWSYGGGATLWEWASAERSLRPAAEQARARLQIYPEDAAAHAALGRWYAAIGVDDWAVEHLQRAEDNGAAGAPLEIGQCLWRLGRAGEALHAYEQALSVAADEDERSHLRLCLAALRTAGTTPGLVTPR